MKSEISKSDFKARALEIFRRLEQSGEPMVITDRGRPRLVIQKFREPERSQLDRLRGSVRRYESPMEPVGEEDWELGQ